MNEDNDTYFEDLKKECRPLGSKYDYRKIDLGVKSFSSERDLEVYIKDNISLIEEGLTIIRSNYKYPYSQVTSGTGPIDILCQRKNGDYVVIELKLRYSSDRAIGQLLRYIGWVKETLIKNHEKVFGYILAKEDSKHLGYTLSALEEFNIVKGILYDHSGG